MLDIKELPPLYIGLVFVVEEIAEEIVSISINIFGGRIASVKSFLTTVLRYYSFFLPSTVSLRFYIESLNLICIKCGIVVGPSRNTAVNFDEAEWRVFSCPFKLGDWVREGVEGVS